MVTRMRHAMEQRLREAGFAAVAPHESPANEIAVRPGVGWSSRWSERHAAFVAGLGTFGLSGGLITRRGVAHRLGSVVTELKLPADHRAYGDAPFAWCLHHADGSCGACRARCPAGAIGTVVPKRDKQACFEWTYDRVRGEKGLAIYGWKGIYGCGLCQTGVPCEDRNPTEE
jgi:epoxyqueuosine reductase QueG